MENEEQLLSLVDYIALRLNEMVDQVALARWQQTPLGSRLLGGKGPVPVIAMCVNDDGVYVMTDAGDRLKLSGDLTLRLGQPK